MTKNGKNRCGKTQKRNSTDILGHGGGRQEGGRKWAGRGGIRIFPAGGGKHFLLQAPKGTVKFQKDPRKCTFKKSF